MKNKERRDMEIFEATVFGIAPSHDEYTGVHPKILALYKAVGARLMVPPRRVYCLAQFVFAKDMIFAHDLEQRHGNRDANLLHELIHWTGAPKRLHRFENDDVEESTQQMVDEEWTAQFGMMLLSEALGILAHGQARDYLERYRDLLVELHGREANYAPAEEQAYRAVGYLKMLAPEVFGLVNNVSKLKEIA